MTCPLADEERMMSIESLVRHLSAVGDPRCQGKIDHRLIDILVIVVCAVIACAESWDDIALYGRSKLAWLRTQGSRMKVCDPKLVLISERLRLLSPAYTTSR